MSPIVGMTDRGLAFPQIGAVRKGAPKTDKGAVGPDLKYFRVEFDEQETKALAQFRATYGEQPTEINIILPFNEIERMWDANLEAYTAGRLVARSDNQYFQYLVNVETGEIIVKNGLTKDGERKAYFEGQPVGYYLNRKTGKKEPIFCKPTGRLKVIVPELARAAYLVVMTTSIHDIINISEQLSAFKALNAGRIAGIPLKLRRRPRSISTPAADGGRARRVKSLLSIEADPEWVKARLTETKRLALPGGNGLALLSAGPAPDAPLDDMRAPAVPVEAEYEDYDEPEDDLPAEPQPFTAEDIQPGEFRDAPAEPEEPPAATPKDSYGKNLPPAAMTLAEAKATLSSDGKTHYGDISSEKLAYMLTSITKAMPDAATDKLHQYELKAAAIKLILASRNDK